MKGSMHALSAEVFASTLGNLSWILEKGAKSAVQRKIDPAVLLGVDLAAAGAGHRDVPPAAQQAGQRGEFVRPADERGNLGRELPSSAPGVNARRSRRIHRHLTELAMFTLHYPPAAPFNRSRKKKLVSNGPGRL